MLFLRRHWPDLVIVSFIVLLLAGFATLLLGGDPRREVNVETLPNAAAPAPAAKPAPQKAEVEPAPAPTPTETAEPAAIPQAPDRAEAAPPPAPETAEPAAPIETAPIETAPIEPAEDLQTIPAQGADGTADPQAAAPDAVEAAPVQTPEEQAPADEPTATPAPGGPVATSRPGTPTRAEYRLSAGVFGNEALARERTEAIAKLGYTVHLIPVDAGVVAQVGPFADGDTAAKAAADVRRVYGNIAVYAPVVKPGETPAAPPAASVPSGGPSAATPAPAPAPPVAEASASPLYLQVGAFDRQESAARLLEQLRAEGLNPTVSAPPGRKVRVLVGPFGGDTLLATEQKLDGLGVDHFRVR